MILSAHDNSHTQAIMSNFMDASKIDDYATDASDIRQLYPKSKT